MYRKPRQPGFIGAFPWFAVATFLATVVLGNWYATQYAASHYRGLGAPLFTFHAHAYYPPFKWLTWIMESRQIPTPQRLPLLKALGIVLGSVFVGILLAKLIIAIRFRRLSSGVGDLHGSARFAKRAEIARAGLFGDEGLIIGGFLDEGRNTVDLLRHPGGQSVLAFAPPGSGKTTGLVIPIMLTHTSNLVAFDTKGELWNLTSGYRSAELGQRCVKFSPVEEDSDGWNALAEIRLGTSAEVADAMNIIKMMVRTVQTTANNHHWFVTAESLGVGLILHECYVAANEGRTASLIDVYNALAPSGMSLKDYMALVRNHEHDINGIYGWVDPDGVPTKTHPEVRRNMILQMNRCDEEFESVVSSLVGAFQVYTDPRVARATSHSSFRMTDLLDGDNPISVYVVVPPSDRERLEPLVRLLFTQVIQRNTETLDHHRPAVRPKDRLLLMLDEAGSLGHMKILADALTFIRGYHIQVYLIFHSIGQIIEHYGPNTALMGSTHVKIAFAPNTTDTAEWISTMTGKATIEQANFSFSGNRGALFGARNVSSQVNLIPRPLLTPDEVSRMVSLQTYPDGRIKGPGEMLIFIAGQYPIFGTQTLYPCLPEFVRRSEIAPPGGFGRTLTGAQTASLGQTLAGIAGGKP